MSEDKNLFTLGQKMAIVLKDVKESSEAFQQLTGEVGTLVVKSKKLSTELPQERIIDLHTFNVHILEQYAKKMQILKTAVGSLLDQYAAGLKDLEDGRNPNDDL